MKNDTPQKVKVCLRVLYPHSPLLVRTIQKHIEQLEKRLELSATERDLVIRLMWDLLDVSEDDSVRRDARSIMRKLGIHNARTRG